MNQRPGVRASRRSRPGQRTRCWICQAGFLFLAKRPSTTTARKAFPVPPVSDTDFLELLLGPPSPLVDAPFFPFGMKRGPEERGLRCLAAIIAPLPLLQPSG